MVATYYNSTAGQRSVIHANATATVVVAGASGVSNLVSNTTEVVIAGTINKVLYASGAGSYWTIKRGANLVGTYVETGVMDYNGHGASLKSDPTANIVATLVGSNGYIIIDVAKVSSFT